MDRHNLLNFVSLCRDDIITKAYNVALGFQKVHTLCSLCGGRKDFTQRSVDVGFSLKFRHVTWAAHSFSLQLLPPRQHCTMKAALVLKQEKNELYENCCKETRGQRV